MSDQFEKTLLSNLIHNEDFTRRTIPFIKEDFLEIEMRLLYSIS